MQRKLVKNLLFVVAVAVLCMAVGLTASAEIWGDYEYSVLEDVTVEIVEYIGEGGEVEIPSEIDGKIVTGIANHAFDRNDAIESVDLPDSIKTIGECAFYSCKNLKYVYMGSGVSSIEWLAFDDCYNLKGFYVDENNNFYSNDEKGILFNKDRSTLVKYPIGRTEKTYEIPYGVKAIHDFAFFRAELTSIDFPDSIVSIGEQAFDWCFGLTTLNIPENVQEIGLGAFADLFFLDKIYIESMSVNLSEYITVASEYAYFSGVSYEEIQPLWKQYMLGEIEYEEIEKYYVYNIEEITWFGTIYCHAGSTAETYAIENGIDYELTHFYEDEWTYDYDNNAKYRKCIHCDETETEAIESETPDVPVTPDEPQEEVKDDLFTKIFDLIKMFFDLIASIFNK